MARDAAAPWRPRARSARARRAGHRISRPVAAGIAALVAYGWWFTDRQPFSGGALLAMLGAAAILITLGTVHRASAQSHGRDQATAHAPALRLSVIAWSVTLAALTGWELIALFSHPRAEHPTVSSLLETAMEHHGPRFGFYLLWLALGWAIAS
jgi:hypothetical protein